MLCPRLGALERCFPFDHPGTSYHYFARNGIYDLARQWGLGGKEVLFPAYFHGVELDALLAAGVRPSFFPVDGGMRVDCKDIVAGITPDTRAVYLIHYLGFPAPVREIAEICRERKVLLIEDCALALLSRLESQPLGTFGDAAVFCLYKTLPVPNGGALVVHRGETPHFPKAAPPLRTPLSFTVGSLETYFESHGQALAASFIRAGMAVARGFVSRVKAERVEVGTQDFDLAEANLAMSSMVRLLLNRQDYPGIVERRRRNYQLLLDQLRGVTTPVFDSLPDGVCPLFYPLRVSDKQAVMDFLLTRKVDTVNFWSASHRTLPEGRFLDVDRLRRSIVELPCHQDIAPETMLWIAEQVKRCPHLL
jgi:dTDP-4-amino-4,6-dideoxygalactose transaminase